MHLKFFGQVKNFKSPARLNSWFTNSLSELSNPLHYTGDNFGGKIINKITLDFIGYFNK